MWGCRAGFPDHALQTQYNREEITELFQSYLKQHVPPPLVAVNFTWEMYEEILSSACSRLSANQVLGAGEIFISTHWVESSQHFNSVSLNSPPSIVPIPQGFCAGRSHDLQHSLFGEQRGLFLSFLTGRKTDPIQPIPTTQSTFINSLPIHCSLLQRKRSKWLMILVAPIGTFSAI